MHYTKPLITTILASKIRLKTTIMVVNHRKIHKNIDKNHDALDHSTTVKIFSVCPSVKILNSAMT